MSTKRYKVTVIAFDGEGETLKAEALYEQTTPTLNIKRVIEAVNADAEFEMIPLVQPRKRAPRSDKGKKRKLTREDEQRENAIQRLE